MNLPQKKSRPILLITLIFLITASLLYFKYQSYINNPVDASDNTTISFQIKKGQSPKEIANNLEDKNLINSSTAFYLYLKIHSLSDKILSGRFKLNKAMNTPKILEALTNPKNAESVITIQEGLTIKDIDEKLVDLDLIKSGEFLQSVKNFNGWKYYTFLDQATLSKLELPLEGYLYPDTYFLDAGNFKPDKLIYSALDNFEKKFSDLQKQIKRHSIHQIITMASIIEKEVFGLENRKIVSGILWKRLENKWTLGADATLLYLSDDNKIRSKDLASDSPYNTRKNRGLPPGPIGNPSLESIEAAMHPTETAYWFYLTTPESKKVIYSKTNDEHNANKAKYL